MPDPNEFAAAYRNGLRQVFTNLMQPTDQRGGGHTLPNHSAAILETIFGTAHPLILAGLPPNLIELFSDVLARDWANATTGNYYVPTTAGALLGSVSGLPEFAIPMFTAGRELIAFWLFRWGYLRFHIIQWVMLEDAGEEPSERHFADAQKWVNGGFRRFLQLRVPELLDELQYRSPDNAGCNFFRRFVCLLNIDWLRHRGGIRGDECPDWVNLNQRLGPAETVRSFTRTATDWRRLLRKKKDARGQSRKLQPLALSNRDWAVVATYVREYVYWNAFNAGNCRAGAIGLFDTAEMLLRIRLGLRIQLPDPNNSGLRIHEDATNICSRAGYFDCRLLANARLLAIVYRVANLGPLDQALRVDRFGHLDNLEFIQGWQARLTVGDCDFWCDVAKHVNCEINSLEPALACRPHWYHGVPTDPITETQARQIFSIVDDAIQPGNSNA